MNILFTRFPLESTLGGAEIQTLSLMEGLRDRGHTVAFLGSCPTLLTETSKRGMRVLALDIGPPPVTPWKAISFGWRKRTMTAKLWNALQRFPEVDTVCMLSLSEKLLVTRWLADRPAKVLWIEHDRIGRWLRQNPWLTHLRRQSAHATTVCVSELSKTLYLDLGWDPERTVAIPNGIDLRRFDRAQAIVRDAPHPLKIGCVARLSPEKGIDLLIDAVADLSDVSLDIVGTGPHEQELRSMIHRRGVDDRIRILPHVDDLRSFYPSINLLVLPSRDHDPFGLVAAEAMACGVPVIVTDACGIAGYLQDGRDAIIVRAGGRDALRQAIDRLRDSAMRRRLSEEGKRAAMAKFSTERMVEEYLSLFS